MLDEHRQPHALALGNVDFLNFPSKEFLLHLSVISQELSIRGFHELIVYLSDKNVKHFAFLKCGVLYI